MFSSFILAGTLFLAASICLAQDTGTPLAIDYPLEGALFPRDMAAPTIRLHDAKANGPWRLALNFANKNTPLNFDIAEPSWRPAPEQWEGIKAQALAGQATLSVTNAQGQRASVGFAVSADAVEAPLFYRDVPLPFVAATRDLDDIHWRMGRVSDVRQPRSVLHDFPMCGNCHSFSADGSLLAMDVDYASDKGSYVITSVQPEVDFREKDVITWSSFRHEPAERTFGFLSRISPDGRHVVSTVKDRCVVITQADLAYSLLFFPIKGFLAIYDRLEKTFQALPGADDPALVQTNAVWNPDGQSIVFARARCDEYKPPKLDPLRKNKSADDHPPFTYDLYTMPFNEGRGGVANPLPGASRNGKSNFFPAFSPDGKWIVFSQARSYMLLQKDSELRIMPAQGGESRALECNFKGGMNSWHAFSPNGRWLGFSSKANGAGTQLWLTHIDDKGHASVPVVLDWFTLPERAANIPEFVNSGSLIIERIHNQLP